MWYRATHKDKICEVFKDPSNTGDWAAIVNTNGQIIRRDGVTTAIQAKRWCAMVVGLPLYFRRDMSNGKGRVSIQA